MTCATVLHLRLLIYIYIFLEVIALIVRERKKNNRDNHYILISLSTIYITYMCEYALLFNVILLTYFYIAASLLHKKLHFVIYN